MYRTVCAKESEKVEWSFPESSIEQHRSPKYFKIALFWYLLHVFFYFLAAQNDHSKLRDYSLTAVHRAWLLHSTELQRSAKKTTCWSAAAHCKPVQWFPHCSFYLQASGTARHTLHCTALSTQSAHNTALQSLHCPETFPQLFDNRSTISMRHH